MMPMGYPDGCDYLLFSGVLFLPHLQSKCKDGRFNKENPFSVEFSAFPNVSLKTCKKVSHPIQGLVRLCWLKHSS